MVFAFGITMTAAILFQLGDPFLPIYSVGCLVGCSLLHVFVVEAERARWVSYIQSSAKVLTDLWMPEMDGRELLRAIRADARLSRLPVYLVTADVDERNQSGSDAFNAVLLKPVTFTKLQPLLA